MPHAIVADLHCHSTASDGADSPTRVVERAAAAGLRVLALTDHDAFDGVAEARAAGARLGVRVIPAAELTCYWQGKQEVNLLAYNVDVDAPGWEESSLAQHCRRFVASRLERARAIGERLDALGVGVDMAKVMARADGGVVGRPHVAAALVEAGHVATLQEAFDKYLGNGKPAEVPKMSVTVAEVIDLVHGAGGVVVIAHPGIWNQFDLIRELVKLGLDGVEVWHSAHSEADSERLATIADDLGLIKTGGSDCHGRIGERQELLGRWGMTESQWQRAEPRLMGRRR